MNAVNLKEAGDDVLVHAIQQGDLRALEEFYDRHHRTALAVAYRVLGDWGLAEDMVQETFLALWRQANRFDPKRGSVRSWFISIARHRAIDATRGRYFSHERQSLEEYVVPTEDADVWQEVSQQLDKELVRKAVQSLPEEQRKTIMLAYFEGYTGQQISERTGVPLGTVKGRIRLGMQKLRGLLVDMPRGGSH